MPQMGFQAPTEKRAGRIHYDGPSGASGMRCEVGRCYKPCEHCKAGQCKGYVKWSMEQLLQGETVYCDGGHPYKLIISG